MAVRLKGLRLFLGLTLVLGLGAFFRAEVVDARTPGLRADWDGRAVHVSWGNRGDYELFRSTSGWDPSWDQVSTSRLPIKWLPIKGGDGYSDSLVASGVNYTYALRSPRGILTTVQVDIPAQILPPSRHPLVRIDKDNYCLEIWEAKRLLKRYPIAMGCDPRKRKLSFDNASTPEGRYHIVQTQAKATYYKAIDLDYPNAADRARYSLLHPEGEIGGEIEIHGLGIARNWTFGCMALRNPDIDELFAHPEIGIGTEVWIYGGEVSLADLQSDVGSPLPALVIGKRQKARGLKVTCLWDLASRAKL